MLLVEMNVAAGIFFMPWPPGLFSLLEFFRRHLDCQGPTGHVEFDDVAIADERKMSSQRRFREACRTTVPKPVPLIRPSEIRTMSVTAEF